MIVSSVTQNANLSDVSNVCIHHPVEDGSSELDEMCFRRADPCFRQAEILHRRRIQIVPDMPKRLGMSSVHDEKSYLALRALQ